MKAEHVSPAVQAVVDVIGAVLKAEPERGTPFARIEIGADHPINVVSQVYGDVAGHVVWGMSVITADKIAGRMLGQPVVTFDKAAAAAICELGMLINAKTVSYLHKAAMECTISPAMIVRGNTKRAGLPKTPALVFPLQINDIGSVELSISTFAKERTLAAAA